MTTETNSSVPETETEQTVHAQADTPQAEDRETIPGDVTSGEGDPAPVDDTEEVEHEGRKYRVPKAVKPLLMLHADYTRKTQDLAEQARSLVNERETLTTERETFATTAQAERQIVADSRELVVLDWQIRQLEGTDFAALQQQDSNRATQLFWQLNQLKNTRDAKARELQHKVADRQSRSEHEAADRRDHARAVIARDIEGWSPEVQSKLANFAMTEFGYTGQDLALVEDPRIVKLLHWAQLGHQAVHKLKAAGGPAAHQAALHAIQPTPTRTVGSSSPANRNPERLSTEEWMEHRQSQLRQSRRRPS